MELWWKGKSEGRRSAIAIKTDVNWNRKAFFGFNLQHYCRPGFELTSAPQMRVLRNHFYHLVHLFMAAQWGKYMLELSLYTYLCSVLLDRIVLVLFSHSPCFLHNCPSRPPSVYDEGWWRNWRLPGQQEEGRQRRKLSQTELEKCSWDPARKKSELRIIFYIPILFFFFFWNIQNKKVFFDFY